MHRDDLFYFKIVFFLCFTLLFLSLIIAVFYQVYPLLILSLLSTFVFIVFFYHTEKIALIPYTSSVIIPAYNEQQNIVACIESVKAQTSSPIIVVDGGSTDKTAELAEQLGATVVYEPRRSIGAARTRGLQAASSDIVCFVDADTIPSPNWFKKIIQPFSNSNVVAVGGSVRPFDGIPSDRFGIWFVFFFLSPLLFFLQVPLVTGQNMAFRRKEALHYGFYSVDGSRIEGEDTIMFLKLRNCGRIKHSSSCVSISMRRVRSWGLKKYLLFNIRNYYSILKYHKPVDAEYEAVR